MSHYFTNDEKLDHQEKFFDVKIKDTTLKLSTDLGVFSKSNLDYGTRVLLENIDLEHKVQTIIDMGCGYGPIGLYLAKTYQEALVYMYDVNLRALDLARKNQALNQIKNAEIEQSFLFENVQVKADVIVTNPPIRAGKKVVFELYEQAYETLKSGGLFYVVINKKQGAPSSVTKIEALFGNIQVIDKNKGYWVLLAEK